MDRGKRGIKRSTAVDARGIPLGTVTAPANRHDSPLLAETLDAVAQTLGELPEGTNIHLDRGYDSEATRQRLRERALSAEISRKGEPAPLGATNRWVVERTIAWIDHNRRMSKDYERLCASGEALVYAAMIRLMTRRFART